MKHIKDLLLYEICMIFVFQLYDEKTFSYILFHYPYLDIRYLLFLSIQFFWTTLLFEIVYQYINLYTSICIRLKKTQTIQMFLKQLLLYCLLYLFIHVILFSIISLQIPYFLLFLNLLVQSISLIFVLICNKNWNYSYILMVTLLIVGHFIV
ncbi:MAG: hypothetical protein ACLUVC_01700 [Longibaculum sp.]